MGNQRSGDVMIGDVNTGGGGSGASSSSSSADPSSFAVGYNGVYKGLSIGSVPSPPTPPTPADDDEPAPTPAPAPAPEPAPKAATKAPAKAATPAKSAPPDEGGGTAMPKAEAAQH